MILIISHADGTTTVSDTRTIAEAQDDAITRVEAEYEVQIAAGAVYAGRPLQIDRESTADMTAMAAQVTAGIPLVPNFAWRMADHTYLPVTGQQVIELGATAAARVYALRLALWAAKDAARAATTREEADATVAEWPKA